MSAVMSAHNLSATAEAQVREARLVSETAAEIYDHVMFEAGKCLEEAQLPDKVQSVRDAVKEVMKVQSEMDALQQALSSISSEYTLKDEPTDFKNLLETKTQAILAASSAPVDDDDRMKNWERHIWAVNHQGEAREGDEDEELVVTGNQQVAVNVRCPLSNKQVLELSDPVEDQKGYVYEKNFVIQYIKDKARRHQSALCPQAGTEHILTEAQLKPARAVKRQQRIQQNAQPEPANDNAFEVE